MRLLLNCLAGMDTGRYARAWLLVGVFLLCGPVYAAEQERVEAMDTNKDGKPDEWKIYQGDKLVRMERDGDQDGKREVQVYFETVPPAKPGDKPATRSIRLEVDRNGDGKGDIVRFMKEGKPDREQGDLNLDGKWDAWSFYQNGVKEFMIVDKNHDGRPDAWFYYDRTGLKLTGGSVDEDFDGKPDRTFGTIPKEETRRPW